MGFDAAATALSFASKLRKRASLTDQIENLAVSLQEQKEAEAAAEAAATLESRRNARRRSISGGGAKFGAVGWGAMREVMSQGMAHGRRHSAIAISCGDSETVCSPKSWHLKSEGQRPRLSLALPARPAALPIDQLRATSQKRNCRKQNVGSAAEPCQVPCSRVCYACEWTTQMAAAAAAAEAAAQSAERMSFRRRKSCNWGAVATDAPVSILGLAGGGSSTGAGGGGSGGSAQQEAAAAELRRLGLTSDVYTTASSAASGGTSSTVPPPMPPPPQPPPVAVGPSASSQHTGTTAGSPAISAASGASPSRRRSVSMGDATTFRSGGGTGGEDSPRPPPPHTAALAPTSAPATEQQLSPANLPLSSPRSVRFGGGSATASSSFRRGSSLSGGSATASPSFSRGGFGNVSGANATEMQRRREVKRLWALYNETPGQAGRKFEDVLRLCAPPLQFERSEPIQHSAKAFEPADSLYRPNSAIRRRALSLSLSFAAA